MGKLSKNILGNPSGAVGKVVFKERGNSVFIGTRPKSYMPGYDTDSINRRKRFGLTGKFSKAVNSIDVLKIVWDAATPNNISPFNGIFKANYHNVAADDVNSTAILTPSVGFKATESSIELSNTEVTATLNALGTASEIDTQIETTIVMAALVYCKGLLDPNFKEDYFMAFKSDPVIVNLTSSLSFSITLSGTENQIFDKFSSHKGFLVFVTLDATGNPIRYSNTFVH